MFFLPVAEIEAFRWIRQELGDTELLLAPPPEPQERALLYFGRVDGRAELLRAYRWYQSRPELLGACWFAGHPQTLAIGERLASFRCGRKFIAYKNGSAAGNDTGGASH